MSDDILQRLMAVLETRKGADPNSSYVAGLYHEGLDSILKKIGEESAETIIAAKSGDKRQIVHETADVELGQMHAAEPTQGDPEELGANPGIVCADRSR